MIPIRNWDMSPARKCTLPPPVAFERTLERVEGVMALHRDLHDTAERPKQHVSDLLRGTLVLAVAALDAKVDWAPFGGALADAGGLRPCSRRDERRCRGF